MKEKIAAVVVNEIDNVCKWCVCVYVCVCVYTCLCVCMYVCICVSMCASVFPCVCAYLCTWQSETEWQHFLRQCLEVVAKVAELITAETFQLIVSVLWSECDYFFHVISS